MQKEKRNTSVMENIAITRVGAEDRRGWLDVMLVQMGCMICVPSLMTGALLIESMSRSKNFYKPDLGNYRDRLVCCSV